MILSTIILIISNIMIFLFFFNSLIIKNKIINNIMIFILVLFISSIISSRDLTGSDTLTYIEYFKFYNSDFSSVYNNWFAWKGDYLFFVIGWIIKQFTDNIQIYIFLLDFLSIFLLIYGIYRIIYISKINNKYLILYLLFLFSSSSFFFLYANVIRQGLAISLIIISISFFIEKKYAKGWFLFILAFFSHKSIIIFFIIFILVFYIKLNWKVLFYISIFSFLIGKLKIITLLGSYNILFISNKIIAYLNAEQHNLFLKIIVLIFNYMVFIYFRNKNYIFDYLLKIWILIFSFVLVTFELGKFSSRLLLYNSIMLPLFYIFILYLCKDNKKMFYFVFILEIGLSFLYSNLIYNYPAILNTIHFTNTIF